MSKGKIIGGEVNQIYQGDCVKLITQLSDGCIDLTITSPPY